MSAGKAQVRPERAEHNEACERLKTGVDDEIGQLHKICALLICAQYTANYGDVEVDISDALAAIIARVERHIKMLDAGCAMNASKAESRAYFRTHGQQITERRKEIGSRVDGAAASRGITLGVITQPRSKADAPSDRVRIRRLRRFL